MAEVKYQEKCLAISIEKGDPLPISKAYESLGDTHWHLREYGKAISYFENGLEIAADVGFWTGQINFRVKLGSIYLCLNQYKEAIRNFEKSLEISSRINYPAAISMSNSRLGIAYQRKGNFRKAIEYSNKSLEISVAIGDNSGIATSIGNLGNAYLSLGEYKKAIEYYEKGLEMSSAVGDKSGIASNNGNLGNAYLNLGEYKKAIEYYKKSLEISCAIGDMSGKAISNGGLGNAYLSLGEYKKAIEYYEKGLEISSDIGDKSGIASNNGNLGNAYLSLGEYKKAIEYYEKGLEISSAIGDKSGIASDNGNLGNAYHKLGEYKKAIEYYEKGLEMSSAIGDKSGIASNNGNLGNAYLSLGKYKKAIEYHEKGLEMSSAIGDKSGIASNNGNLGNAYRNLGEYKKAIEYYEKGLEISSAIGDMYGIASSNGGLGNAYRNLGENKKAIEYYEKGLEISSAIGDMSGIASSNGGLGNAYLSLGEYKKAIEYYEKGLEISSTIGDKSGIASNNGNLGNAYVSLGEYKKAIECYEKGLKMSSSIQDEPLMGINYGNLGNAHRRIELYKVALSYLERSIKLFDRIFLGMVPDRCKLSYAGEYFRVHKISMACLLAIKNSKAALLVLDRGRAKELNFTLQKQAKIFKKGMEEYANSVWDWINAGEEDLELKELEIILQPETCPTTALVFAFDLEMCLNVWILKEGSIHKKLDVTFKELYLLITEYLEKFNVSVSRDSSFFSQDVSPNSDEDVFQSGLPVPHEKTSSKEARVSKIISDEEILQLIFQNIIHPLKDLIDGNKLIIVPDGPLFFAPFSSLIDEHGSYLSENYSIQITPSLQSLRASMKKVHDSNLGFALFVGNPTVREVSLNGQVFTPSDLPNAAEEVKCVSQLFQATPILGRKAKKPVLLELLDKASIIHIAAHGEPNSGEILLAPNHSQDSTTSSPSTQESFLLTQQDVMNISVKARLVVLSCCDTGKGKVSSEGVIGITRAFLTAGARSVLATLWPINDSATKEFMEKFYKDLCQGRWVCEALRRTKNIFQKHEKKHYQSVNIWAPFTIYGEDVKFKEDEIEKIKKESREFFKDFVILP